MDNNKNDEAWNSLFKKYNILSCLENEDHRFVITADDVREFREPRLMAKFDHASSLPSIFADNNLSILPISRGEYVIAPYDTFHSLENDYSSNRIIQLSLPDNLQSITNDISSVISESIALNIASAAGILSDFFEIRCSENNFLIPTVSGRMGSGSFSFYIKNIKNGSNNTINVNNAQIEIDAAYESCEFLAIFEAKRNLYDDFIIRQLYYPYRVWKDKITKDIKPIFLTYSNGIFHLREYSFEDPLNYNSIKLIKEKRYSLESNSISSQDIQEILSTVSIVPEPCLPFPQADSFERVINICELAKEQPLSKDQITNQYVFDPRQTDYYSNAALYLGLLTKIETDDSCSLFALSDKGKTIMQSTFKSRQLGFCKLILSHKAFRDTLDLYFNKTGTLPSREEVISIMQNSNLYNISSSETFSRRAATIQSWIKWIVGLINC